MSDIQVNKLIWDAVSEQDKQRIAAHLREYGVLKPEQNLIASDSAPFPEIKPHSHELDQRPKACVKALGVDWLCRAICDSSNAEKDCSVYGQSVLACLATIAASREELA